MAVTERSTDPGMKQIAYEELVLPDRIHGSLYTEPRVFADELERIFYRSWVYIGHDSEVPNPGDYARKQLGLQPVVMTRDSDGQLHVLLNRCAHVANLVCHENRGRTKAFRCPYHGWTYGLDGTCLGIPFNKAYGPDPGKSGRSLASPAQVDSYRGFVFASVNPDVPDLREHLGRATDSIDQLCDLSPEGEIELSAGWLRHLTRSNWKIGYEGLVDGYHPGFVHQSLVRVIGDTYNFDASDNSYPLVVVRDLGNGHADLDFRPHYRSSDREFQWFTGGRREKLPRYVEGMEASYGKERAHQILVDGPPHTIIFPNLFLGELFVMVVDLVDPLTHIELQTPVAWKGAEEVNSRNLHQTHASLGPAGMVIADDTAMFERNQKGLMARQPEWLMRDRGGSRSEVGEDGIRRSQMTDDVAVLGFWHRYRELMACG